MTVRTAVPRDWAEPTRREWLASTPDPVTLLRRAALLERLFFRASGAAAAAYVIASLAHMAGIA